MRAEIVRALPEDLWREFVGLHPGGNIFHTPEMFKVFSQAEGHRPDLWAALDEKGKPMALFLPVLVSFGGGRFKRLLSRMIAYGSILCEPGPRGAEACAELLAGYKLSARKEAVFTELRNLSDMSGLQPVFQGAGFKSRDEVDFLVDLERSGEDLMRGFARKTRKAVRRALRDPEMAVEEVTSLGGVRAWYGLLQKTYARARVPLADPSLFEAAFRVLHPAGMARFLVARRGGVDAAASVELVYKRTVVGWYGGLDREYRRHHPNELLTWEILKWGADRGCAVYDFGGAGDPARKYGVRDFKAKFGGRPVAFGRNVWVHSPVLLCLSRIGYAVGRSVPALRPGRGGKHASSEPGGLSSKEDGQKQERSSAGPADGR